MNSTFSALDIEAQVAGLIGSSLLTAMQAGGNDRSSRRKILRFLGAVRDENETGKESARGDGRPQPKRATSAERSPEGTRGYAVLRFFNEQLGITKPLYRILERPVPECAGTPEASVWQTLFKPYAPSAERQPWDLSVLAEESRQKADMIQKRFREALPQFLYGRTGSVLVNSSTGDFRGYRDYGEGDSLRQVDWKRSVKDGSLSVRLRDEEEARGIRLVYDTEHLVNAYKEWRKLGADERARQDNPLRDLFVLCHLAARENIQVDLVLYSRSHMETVEGVVKRNTSSPRGHFKLEEVMNDLECHMRSANEIYEAEQKIYGAGGMTGVDIFAASDLPAKRGQLHLFGVADRNDDNAYAQRAALKKRRILAASMNDTRDPRLRRSSNG